MISPASFVPTTATAVVLAALLSAAARATAPPHIVFVMLDDVGMADLGEFAVHALPGRGKRSAIPTPTLDRLAREGVRLSNYYVQPTCSPTRASLLTGRYAINHGVWFPVLPDSPVGLPREMATLPQELRKLGYSAHMVGKVSRVAPSTTFAHCPPGLVASSPYLIDPAPHPVPARAPGHSGTSGTPSRP